VRCFRASVPGVIWQAMRMINARQKAAGQATSTFTGFEIGHESWIRADAPTDEGLLELTMRELDPHIYVGTIEEMQAARRPVR